MADEFSSHSARITARVQNFLTAHEPPTIKILLYTDAPSLVVTNQVDDFGLGKMIAHTQGHGPRFAKLDVKLIPRYSEGSKRADRKINVVLAEELEQTKEPFDEIWFFGIHQVNKKTPDLGLNGGGPESELDDDEIKALRSWMDQGGGVFVTGDHAELRPSDALPPSTSSICPDPYGKERYLSLGRALGRCIPRAGLMRDWEGSPTAREDDSNDTEVVTFGLPSNNFGAKGIFQTDRIPQQLVLQSFDEVGRRSRRGQSHPLFFYKPGLTIDLFPDHLHEGAVRVPKKFDDDLWPTDAQKNRPEPVVIASGTDKRSGRIFNLMAAYDGDAAGVGRIVSDSSWHHYFNMNLNEFSFPADEGSPGDQIGQFYGNLALWLAPAQKRAQMAHTMFRWLAHEPVVVDGLGPRLTGTHFEKLRAGSVAHALLTFVASPCEINELLQVVIPKAYRYLDPSAAIFLPDQGSALSRFPSKDLLLGSIMDHFPGEPVADVSLSDWERLGQTTRGRWDTACATAFAEHHQSLSEIAGSTQEFLTLAQAKTLDLRICQRGFETELARKGATL